MAIGRQVSILSCAVGAIGLAGCGGGGGGVNSLPAPIAQPGPATPPPPAATYADFDNATELGTVAYGLSGDITITQEADGNYVIGDMDYRQFEVGPGTNDYAFEQPSPGLFAMDIHGFGGSLFQVADGGALFDRSGMSSDDWNETLQVSKAGVGLDLTYTRFGSYSWGGGVGQAEPGYVSFLALGVPTVLSDRPVSGTASYNGFVDGVWHDGETMRRLFGSTADLSVDFGSGTLTTLLTLVGRDDPFGDFLNGQQTALGTFSGSGTIDSNINAFSGSFTPQGGWSGAFGGAFNGPQAAEYGYVFGLTNSNGSVASGVAVGRRN